ncbi:MAG: DNA primase [Cytophagales bacterium]|nr:DNA primase [Cytophagales bacterium]
MSISQYTIQSVKDRVEIEEVVSDFVTLKRKGNNLWACCPFHYEKTPSFSVAPNKGIYKCFGCGASGDAMQFVMDIEGLNYAEAVRYLAAKYGIPVEENKQSDESLALQKEKDSLLIVLNFAKEYYQNALWTSAEGKSIGLSYFKERGFTQEIIEKFQLGYAYDQWDKFAIDARVKGYSDEMLEKAGLLIVKDGGRKKFDRFRSRVIFPIHSLSGKTIAFGARTLSKDKKTPKYLNSPETEVYHKSKVLYGIHQAKQRIRQEDNCYLVEGYTDVISMHLADVENVVASSGTSLTDDQIRLISRFTKNVTVLFDGDSAGIKASLRGIDMILEGGMNVKAVVFPEGEDPDSYSRKIGKAAFQKYLEEKSQDFIAFKAGLYANQGTQDPVKKAETIKDIVASIVKIPDEIKRTVYVKECSSLLKIEESILIAELNRGLYEQARKGIPPKAQPRPQQAVPAAKSSESRVPAQTTKGTSFDQMLALQEKESLRLLLNFGLTDLDEEYKLHDYLLSELEEVEFQTPVYRGILEMVKQLIGSEENLTAQSYLDRATEEQRTVIIDLMTQRFELSPNWLEKHQIYVKQEPDILRDSAFTGVLRLKLRMLNKLVALSTEKLKSEQDSDELMNLLRVIKGLKEAENEIAKMLGVVLNR